MYVCSHHLDQYVNERQFRMIDKIYARISAPYPPVSERTVQIAEERLGFSLPPLLKELYLRVGNGGFGPQESSLIGLYGGYLHMRKYTLDEIYNELRSEKDEQMEEQDQDDVPYQIGEILYNTWPPLLLEAFSWPCAIYTCINCAEQDYPVYIIDGNMYGYCVQKNIPVPIMRHKNSFAEWLQAWIDGEDLWTQMDEMSTATAILMDWKE